MSDFLFEKCWDPKNNNIMIILILWLNFSLYCICIKECLFWSPGFSYLLVVNLELKIKSKIIPGLFSSSIFEIPKLVIWSFLLFYADVHYLKNISFDRLK